MSLKIITTKGFEHELMSVNFYPKTFLMDAYMLVAIKKGFLGERLKWKKEQFKEIEIMHEEEVSTDTAQRIKHAAIGAVLLGPIGLLGAALGGKKTLMKVRFLTIDEKQFVLEIKPKDCEKIFKEFLNIDLQQEANKALLK